MSSVFNSRFAVCALAAVMGLSAGVAGQASAADLGGDCCADLEERIAELEATTARKGNRKVKLEISGQVNEAVMWWDDGVESNAYVVTNENSRSRFRVKGDAKINDDMKAGYLIEIGVRTVNGSRVTQDNDSLGGSLLDIRHSVWYVDHKKLGRVWVGLTGGAGEGSTETNLAATKDIAKFSDVQDSGTGMIMLVNGVRVGGGVQWFNLLRGGGDQPGEGRRWNMVRYDTPEIAGFTATANWGEDDGWEVGLRYKGEFGDFKMAAAIAYGESGDGTGTQPFQCVGNQSVVANDRDCEQLGGSFSVMHSPTGLYANFGAGYMDDNAISTDVGFTGGAAVAEDRSDFYAVEAGIEQKWNALGKTTIFGQYFVSNGGSQDLTFNGRDIVDSEMTAYGAGVIQGIDAAAMHVYLTYRHYEADVTTGLNNALTAFEADDLDVVMGGALIKF